MPAGPGFHRQSPRKGHTHCSGSFRLCLARPGRNHISQEKGKMLREPEGPLELGERTPALLAGSEPCCLVQIHV